MYLYHGHKFDIENLYEQIEKLADKGDGLQFKNGMWHLLHETKKIRNTEMWRMSALKDTIIRQIMRKLIDPETYFKSLETKPPMKDNTIELILDGVVLSKLDISNVYDKWAFNYGVNDVVHDN